MHGANLVVFYDEATRVDASTNVAGGGTEATSCCVVVFASACDASDVGDGAWWFKRCCC